METEKPPHWEADDGLPRSGGVCGLQLPEFLANRDLAENSGS